MKGVYKAKPLEGPLLVVKYRVFVFYTALRVLNSLSFMAVEIEFKDVDSRDITLECGVNSRRGVLLAIDDEENGIHSRIVLNRETCAQLAKHLRRTIHEYDLVYGIDGKKPLSL